MRTFIKKSILTLALIVGCLLLAWNFYDFWSPPPTFAASPPPEYQDLYSFLEYKIESFDAKISNTWDGTIHNVDYAAELTTANAHRGALLIKPENYTGIILELDALKALGVKAVNISISFPVLYESYHKDFRKNAQEYSQFLSVYKNLVEEAHSRGLKVIMTSGSIFGYPYADSSLADVADYHKYFSIQTYAYARSKQIEAIARELNPDSLIIGAEPDTEQTLTGLAGWDSEAVQAAFTSYAADLVHSANPNIKVGKGTGTWHPYYKEYARAYAQTSIDFIDMHIYPINQNLLDRTLDIAEIATAAGKGLSIDEAWLFKVRDSELGATNAANDPKIFARDFFSFWQPLDSKFIKAIVKLANYKKFDFISFPWPRYFHAYLDYETDKNLSYDQLNAKMNPLVVNGIVNKQFSQTGLDYASYILNPPRPDHPDTTPPSVPSELSANPVSQNQINLSWNPSADDVGVSYYSIERCANPSCTPTTFLTTTSSARHSDVGLAANTVYKYRIKAVDFSNNSSGYSSTVSATTAPKPSDISDTFIAGQKIKTISNLNVRSEAGLNGQLLGVKPVNSFGTVVSGGMWVDGFFWWNIDYDTAPDGYSIENYLTPASKAGLVGDFNGDGVVNSTDLSLMIAAWNTNNAIYDLNRDNLVNSLDYPILLQNWSR